MPCGIESNHVYSFILYIVIECLHDALDTVLLHKLGMELLKELEEVTKGVLRRQEGAAQVVCVGALTKARARHHTDTCLLYQLHTVERIGRHLGLRGSLYVTGVRSRERERE